MFFFFKQKTEYERSIRDWSSDVCSSDRQGMPTAARELLFDAPSKPEFAALWWRERSWHIREAMDRGDLQDAYTLAASHVQTRGVAFAHAERSEYRRVGHDCSISCRSLLLHFTYKNYLFLPTFFLF